MVGGPLFAHVPSPKVVVVGGGLAGLTTAYRLHEEGIEVELYEARSRVGGRVLTACLDGHMVELGGQNLTDGGESVHTRRLIEECGLEVTSGRVNINHSYFNEKDLIPLHELFKKQKFEPETLYEELQSAVAQAQSMKDLLDLVLQENDPLYKVTAVRLASYEGASIEKLSPFYINTLFHMLLGGVCTVHQKKWRRRKLCPGCLY